VVFETEFHNGMLAGVSSIAQLEIFERSLIVEAQEQISPFNAGDVIGGLFGRVSRLLGRVSSGFGVGQALADELQLHPEQSDLEHANEDKAERKCRYGVCREPSQNPFGKLLLSAA
jgi:hypothetical protein